MATLTPRPPLPMRGRGGAALTPRPPLSRLEEGEQPSPTLPVSGAQRLSHGTGARELTDNLGSPLPHAGEGRGVRVALALALLLCALDAGVVPRLALGASSALAGPAAAQRPYSVALSTGAPLDPWHIVLANDFKAACAMPPYRTAAQCLIEDARGDARRQARQIDDLILLRVDAIVLDTAPAGTASAARALSGAVGRACARGVLVVAVDAPAPSSCALTVGVDDAARGRAMAGFLATALGGRGNLLLVTPQQPTPADRQAATAATAVFARFPRLRIVDRVAGDLSSAATAQGAVAKDLPRLPRLDGVFSQGGTDGALRALAAAHRSAVAVAGDGSNGFRKQLLSRTGLTHGLSLDRPSYLAVAALALATRILQGSHARASVTLPAMGVTERTVRAGQTVFPALPDSFPATFTDSGPGAVVVLCAQAAYAGAPCPGSLTVRLP